MWEKIKTIFWYAFTICAGLVMIALFTLAETAFGFKEVTLHNFMKCLLYEIIFFGIIIFLYNK